MNITIYYRHGDKIDNLKYEGEIFDESELYNIITDCISKKYSVMIQPSKEDITIWIGKGSLTQH